METEKSLPVTDIFSTKSRAIETDLAIWKNLGRLWLAFTELQGEFYMLQLISIDSYEMVLISISPKDVGLLSYHQMLERIMGNYQLKLPYILSSFLFFPTCQDRISSCVFYHDESLQGERRNFVPAGLSCLWKRVKNRRTFSGPRWTCCVNLTCQVSWWTYCVPRGPPVALL